MSLAGRTGFLNEATGPELTPWLRRGQTNTVRKQRPTPWEGQQLLNDAAEHIPYLHLSRIFRIVDRPVKAAFATAQNQSVRERRRGW